MLYIIDGVERLISYVFCLLNIVEKGYFQFEKKVFVVVWGIKKFYNYFYG